MLAGMANTADGPRAATAAPRRLARHTFGRPISDPQALRALAHTGRYAILERLQSRGPATATECADVAGLSPSACSYHLRLLAKYGFVEEDTSDDAAAATAGSGSGGRRSPGWVSDPAQDADPREIRLSTRR